MEALAIIMLFLTIGFLVGSNFLIFQKGKIPSVKLTSIDGTEFYSDHVISDGEPVIVVFWKPSETDLNWQFEQMLEAREQIMGDKQARIVAIYDSPFGHNYQLNREIKDCLNSINRPDIEIYFDGKGKMRKKLGIPQVPYTMVYDRGCNEIQYFGFKIYNNENSFEINKPGFAVD